MEKCNDDPYVPIPETHLQRSQDSFQTSLELAEKC